MASQIDPTVPVDGQNVPKSSVRNNFAAAAGEIETLQDQVQSLPISNLSATGTPDATTCLRGNSTWGSFDPALVNSGERTAGTETAARSFSPNDIRLMIGIHAPGATATAPWTDITGSMAAAPTGLSRSLTGNVNTFPTSNGWINKLGNFSGSGKTITGDIIKVEDGSVQTVVTLGNNKTCIAHVNAAGKLVIEGDVT